MFFCSNKEKLLTYNIKNTDPLRSSCSGHYQHVLALFTVELGLIVYCHFLVLYLLCKSQAD